ncbi:MAG: vitamin K epoxide reductase family protein [Flavobacteriaceae bacterium]|jgi:hypothetical protein|nr:vitamin K epoxide reductase family protein [Flavobacteriaceae bacterium]
MKENALTLIKYLKLKKIYLDRNEFLFRINSHPNYPSLLSIVSALNYNGVRNYVLELDNSDVENLPDDFMTFVTPEEQEPKLVAVKKKNEKYIIENRSFTHKEFVSQWNNIAVLIDKTESAVTSKNYKNSVLRTLSIIYFAFYIYACTKIYLPSFFLLSFCGFLISILAIRKTFGNESFIEKKICSGNSYLDCSFSDVKKKSITSYFADFSFIYFLLNILATFFLFIANQHHFYKLFFEIQKLLLIVILPVVGYSLFYQFFKAKKICPLCMGIVAVLSLQTCLIWEHFH